jgi:hypothetical protein
MVRRVSDAAAESAVMMRTVVECDLCGNEEQPDASNARTFSVAWFEYHVCSGCVEKLQKADDVATFGLSELLLKAWWLP